MVIFIYSKYRIVSSLNVAAMQSGGFWRNLTPTPSG